MKPLTALARHFVGLLLLGMVFLNVANAAGRYIFKKAIPGSDEVLVFAMVWLVFLGAVLVAIRNDHLGFDLLSRRLSGRPKRCLQAFRCLVISGITGFVAWQSWTVLKKLALVGQSSMATEIPMVVPHAAIFVSFALISLVSLVQVFRPPPIATVQSKAVSAEERQP